MRGIPGSGKTTEAQRWAQLIPKTPILSVDTYMFAGGREFNPFLLEHCHEQCRKDFEHHLKDLVPLIIVDNTNTKFSSIVPYVELIERHQYGFTVMQIHCDPKIALERNVHGVPLVTLERMAKHMWFERLPSTWDVWNKGKPWRPTDIGPVLIG
jgi:tRNA uridine 5-carbamoylmethylation protein Kti12